MDFKILYKIIDKDTGVFIYDLFLFQPNWAKNNELLYNNQKPQHFPIKYFCKKTYFKHDRKWCLNVNFLGILKGGPGVPLEPQGCFNGVLWCLNVNFLGILKGGHGVPLGHQGCLNGALSVVFQMVIWDKHTSLP
jgi:hypothetical protein